MNLTTRFIIIFWFLLSNTVIAQEKTIIKSSKPALRWEEAMISGNGSTGVMVYGNPDDETIIINHEKCWVPISDYSRKVANMQDAIQSARTTFHKGKIGGASQSIYDNFSNWNLQNLPLETLSASYGSVKSNAGGDKVHPAFCLKWLADENTEYTDYSREMVLDNAEVNVRWSDDKNRAERNIFVSRTDDVIVWRMRSVKGRKLNGMISAAEMMRGKKDDYTKDVVIDYTNDEIYFYSSYNHSWGKPIKEGYHAVGRIICKGGTKTYTSEGVRIKNADEVLLVMRFEFLMDVTNANRKKLSTAVKKIKPTYSTLLKRNAKVHGEMLRRVKVDFGGNHAKNKTTEEILKETSKNGVTPELLELLHDLGRYTLICSSGEFPPALMGIWGGSWNPAWTGHYTFDSNIQLAISAAAMGNLPEASQSYFNLIKTMYPDWETNASELFGNRGYHASMGSSWRKGSGLNGGSWFSFTGAAGWLTAYFHEHYLCTGDKEFLRNTEVPLLKNIAMFYEDFLKGMEDKNGKYIFYPSISPESMPDKVPGGDLRHYITPNATSEIAICSFVLRTLIKSCNELGIEQKNIPIWENMLAKMPDYLINDDGALHEWSYPGVEASYGNKHCSQFFGLYPAVDVNKFDTPDSYAAIKKGLKIRAETKKFSLSGHSLLHDCFFYARTRNSNYLWNKLDVFATQNFFYNSLLSSHFPNGGVYNLDISLCLPAVIMEMLVSSRPGTLQLLPGVLESRLPKGSIQGMLAKGGVTIENLSWDLTTGSIEIKLNSKTDQSIELEAPSKIKDIVLNKTKLNLGKSKRGENWRVINLKANESTDVTIKF